MASGLIKKMLLGVNSEVVRMIMVAMNYDKDNEKIAFVIGADNLPLIEKWINVEGILSEFKIIVLGRNNIDISNIIKNNPLTILKKIREP